MKNWKRVLAVLLVLAMSLSMAAISEEVFAPEQAGQSEQAEVPVEEEPAEEAEEPEAEGQEAEPSEEPTEESPEEEEEPEQEAPAEDEPAEGESEAGEPDETESAEEPADKDEDTELNAKGDKCPKNPDGDEHEWGYDKETREPTGICVYCGAKCPHKDKFTDYWIANDRVEQFDQARHIIYYDQMATIICNDCEVEIETKTIKTNLVTTEEHWFDDWGKETDTCTKCGYVNQECKHEHTSIWCEPLDDDVKYKKVNGVTHLVSGNLNIRESCDDCQKKIRDVEGYFTNIAEKHRMNSEEKDNKCACGFKSSACKHQDNYIASHDGFTAYIINYGNQTYHYRHYNNALRVCNLCYNIKSLGAYNQKEEHVFKDGSSVCALCGYKVQASSVSIDKPEKTALNVGETLKLTAKIAPANALSDILWYSSNRAVATVSSQGVVTARAVGSTNITARTENGKASKALKLTIVDPRIPTKLTLPKKLSAELGQTVEIKSKLTALEPATAELKWSSSKPEIVEIDAVTGSAKMLDTGSAKISVTAATVSGKGAKSASVTISVTDPKAPSKITLSPEKAFTMTTADAPKQITASLNAEAQGSCEITWSSSKPDVAQVDENGNVTAISKGSTKITATASKKNSQGKLVSASVSVKVTADDFYPEDIQLNVGDSLSLTTDSEPVKITATVLPADVRSGGVTWKNSNSYAVKLDPATGTLTPQAEGTATITISSSKKAANKKAIVKKITVNVTDPHAITSFMLAEGKAKQLFLGETLTLTPVFGGENERSAVIYTLKKNPGIVKIGKEDGMIEPLKEGSVEITATTAKKGPGVKAKPFTAKIKIQVVDPKRPKEIAIDQMDSLKTVAIGKPVKLSCTITAEDGSKTTDGVKWSVSDKKKALIDDEGNLYALKSGVTVTITAMTDAKGVNGKAKKALISLKTE